MLALKGNLHQHVWRGIKSELSRSRCRRGRSHGAWSGRLQLCDAQTPPSSSTSSAVSSLSSSSKHPVFYLHLRLLVPHPLLSSTPSPSSPTRSRPHPCTPLPGFVFLAAIFKETRPSPMCSEASTIQWGQGGVFPAELQEGLSIWFPLTLIHRSSVH